MLIKVSTKQTIQKQRPTNHGMDQVWGSFRIKNRALYTLFASDRLLAVGFSGCCHCGEVDIIEVKIIVTVWTIHRDQKWQL